MIVVGVRLKREKRGRSGSLVLPERKRDGFDGVLIIVLRGSEAVVAMDEMGGADSEEQGIMLRYTRVDVILAGR